MTGATGGGGGTTVALLAHAGFEVVASSGKSAEHAYLERAAAYASSAEGSPRTTDGRWAPTLGRGGRLRGRCSALAEALRTVRYGGAWPPAD